MILFDLDESSLEDLDREIRILLPLITDGMNPVTDTVHDHSNQRVLLLVNRFSQFRLITKIRKT